MCKLLTITNMSLVQVNEKFLGICRDELTKTSDKDGFGYAVLGQDGSLGGERTTKPSIFQGLTNKSLGRVDSLPFVGLSKNKFGTISTSSPKSFIAHGRFSTNSVSLENTHPFTSHNAALIHNGVVDDESDFLQDLKTDCDTEILFKHFELGGMNQVARYVSGYYAFMYLDKVTRQLHIARDDQAMLYVTYSPTIDSFIFATTIEIIKGISKKMKWKVETPEIVNDNSYIVFDGNTILSHSTFSPIGKTSFISDSKVAASLGKTYATNGETAYLDSLEDEYTEEDLRKYYDEIDRRDFRRAK